MAIHLAAGYPAPATRQLGRVKRHLGRVPTTPDRQICRKPDTGQSVHITSDPGRNSDSQVLTSVEFGPARTMDDEIFVLWWYVNRRQNKKNIGKCEPNDVSGTRAGRGEHERGERGTDTGTNSFTLLRARSFYRQFVVTKRSVKMPGSAKMPDPG
ncbi:Uncharacterized protein OBRU01_03075 [Operophtera brumata]|uniref:Uncharacterized protein n=1 Tax=Operophtera brumata TaxID=104452 RepID=A0A0L7LRT6_OPEBR|nr:Uncharacterized protein OBRU01_03075 [Operophtera brumata]